MVAAKQRHLELSTSPKLGDAEAGAFVRIIEMNGLKKGGENGLEKVERTVGHRLKQHSFFPWRVLVPLNVTPRLRGLILLNLVSQQRSSGQAGRGCRRGAAPAAHAHRPAQGMWLGPCGGVAGRHGQAGYTVGPPARPHQQTRMQAPGRRAALPAGRRPCRSAAHSRRLPQQPRRLPRVG